MNILKLLRGVIARVKAIGAQVRSRKPNTPGPKTVSEGTISSPHASDVPTTPTAIETAIATSSVHLSGGAKSSEEGTTAVLFSLDSTPSQDSVGSYSLEPIVASDENLAIPSALPHAAVPEMDGDAAGEHPPPATVADEYRQLVYRRRRPRKPYSDVSDDEVSDFLARAEHGSLDEIADLTAQRLDTLLREALALSRVRLIGELPISPSAFQQIAEVMRKTYDIHGTLTIPPALFVTSMVFCARYSQEEARNFWTPYAQLVWDRPEADASFQIRCRRHFIGCRECLKEWYGLSFPIIKGQDGSVVRPVYHHAVIPYYLEDAFAGWLVQHLEHLQKLAVDYGPDALPTLLSDEPSLNRIPPSLRSFILGEMTSATAAALIIQLCEAATAYLSGEENVAHLISSPIERALWHKVQRELDGEIERKQMRRGPQPVLTWGWSLEDEELQLRLAHVSGSHGIPDLCVWTEKGETALSDSECYEVLERYLWRDRNGWSLDEIRLSGGPIEGQIAVLSEDHEDDRPDVLLRKDVPAVPSGVIVFARESRQDWAMFVGRERVTDGDWLISMAEGVALCDADGRQIASYKKEYVPNLLREHSAHITAGRYALQLPVTVTQGGEPLFTIERMPEQIGTPVLEGPCQLPDLSSRIPPVFTGPPITLHIPGMTNELLSHTVLSVRSATFHKPYSLEELRTGSAMSISVEGDCTIALDTLFPDEAGVYTLDLRRGLKSLLDEPLQFSYLPGVEVEAPELKRHYTPANLPSAHIYGVTVEQVVVGTRADVEPIDGGIQVTWHVLKSPECSLRLEINDHSIPLAWPISRTYAWVNEDHPVDGTPRILDCDIAVIHIRGTRRQSVTLRVAADSEREFSLDAKGTREIELSRDQLIEMIEVRRETHVPVEIAAEGDTWPLFVYVRKPDLTVRHVTYNADKKQLVLECEVGRVCEGEFLVQVSKASAPADEMLAIRDFHLLKESLIFDCDLSPGQYEVQILSSGEQVDGKALHIAEASKQNETIALPTTKPREPGARKARQRPPLIPWTQIETKWRRVGIPQFQWSIVPAGCFLMGGDPLAEGAWQGGEFDLPYPFWVSIYPVTVAQFRVFVEQGGYNNYESWKSQCWSKKGEPPELERRGSYRDEHPITNVTWCEAFAFANWLNDELPGVKPVDAPEGYVIRLARECEWEKAARYPDGRLFPWGDEWDPTRLSWRGHRGKGLRPVGSFPDGVHAELGVHDLLGGINEWCLTAWRDAYISPQNEDNFGKAGDKRCVRGGSWKTDDTRRLRSAARMKASPGYRSEQLGFRLVVSKPTRWL